MTDSIAEKELDKILENCAVADLNHNAIAVGLVLGSAPCLVAEVRRLREQVAARNALLVRALPLIRIALWNELAGDIFDIMREDGEAANE